MQKLYFPIWSFFFLAAGLARAATRPFWYDEIYTFTISRLAPRDIFQALASGTDLNPPGLYLTLSVLYRVFGASELTTRLPALFGFWFGCYCLYRYAREHVGPMWAILCATLPAIAYARYYAAEGRPYGVVFGCAALAFWSWSQRRRVLVGVALAVAISFHYYAVLIWIPLGLAELSRGKKVDWRMWAAFLLGAVPLIAFIPFIEAARGFSGLFWARPRLGLLGAFYWKLIGIPLAAASFITLVVTRDRRRAPIPREQTVAAAGFCFIFAFLYLIAVFVTRAFYISYGLIAIIGFSLLAIHVSQWRRGWVALALCFGLFLYFAGADVEAAIHHRYPDPIPTEVKSLPTSSPIVVTTPHEFLEMDYYGLHDRVVWLSDRALSMRYWGNASDTVALLALDRWRPMRIENYRTFVARRQPFFLYGEGWVTREISSDPTFSAQRLSPLVLRITPRQP